MSGEAMPGPGPDKLGWRYPPGLSEMLVAAVRSEFRAAVLVIDPADPVFGGVPCLVGTCRRAARVHELCSAHFQRWAALGRPEKSAWVEGADAAVRGDGRVKSCAVPGCGFGRNSTGLCVMHIKAWRRAGSPGIESWIGSGAVAVSSARYGICRLAGCELWAAKAGLCVSHAQRWRQAGRPDLEAFVAAHAATPAHCETIDLLILPPRLRLEVQYALQQRHDEQKAPLIPKHARHAINVLAASGMVSLLEYPEDRWRERVNSLPGMRRKASGPFLSYARRQVENLLYGTGWEVEFDRDVWRLRNLGIEDCGRATLRFGAIGQDQFKTLAKRWVRWRLSAGSSLSNADIGLRALIRFTEFLARAEPGIERPGQLSRAVLERYLADIASQSEYRRQRAIGQLGIFLTDVRRHRWDETLPADVVFYREDIPRRAKQLPRALAEYVMAQLEDPANLDRWTESAYRLITLILMRCGLRINDATRVMFECIVHDADGAPYLRYTNHKMKREALVPIDEELEHDIREQQRRVLERWPGGVPVLFPRKLKNIHGRQPMRGDTYRQVLDLWLERCQVRDANGAAVHLTPHQWRHTLGTRLINRDVPQEVVRRILDHDSHEMTAHYARLHDTTIRRHWEAARKVNIGGEQVVLDPDGPLAEAAWAKQRVGRASQALPNGYCSLPVVKTCPHANSCLTCPMFVTTAEFLPQHRRQRTEVLQIITAGEARGQQRLVEMNRQVLANLDNIITSLDEDADENDGQGQMPDAS